MDELKEILLGMLVMVYGIVFYIVGRINLLEKFVLKLNEMLVSNLESSNEQSDGKENSDE